MERDISDAAIIVLIIVIIAFFFGGYFPLRMPSYSTTGGSYQGGSYRTDRSSNNSYTQTTVTETVTETNSGALY